MYNRRDLLGGYSYTGNLTNRYTKDRTPEITRPTYGYTPSYPVSRSPLPASPIGMKSSGILSELDFGTNRSPIKKFTLPTSGQYVTRPNDDGSSRRSSVYQKEEPATNYSTNTSVLVSQEVNGRVTGPELQQDLSTSGIIEMKNISPRIYNASPMRGLQSSQRTITSSYVGCSDNWTCLEPYGIHTDTFSKEKDINREMIKATKSMLEMARMIKNSMAALRNNTNSGLNIYAQMNSKTGSFKQEYSESICRLKELHCVDI